MERLTKYFERGTYSSEMSERSTRFLVHPLLHYDPDAANWIKVIRAEYFEDEIDLGVELAVFVGTVLVLRRIYPKFSAFRILMGLVRSTSVLMLSGTFSTWLMILTFQSTLSGLDLTLKFE